MVPTENLANGERAVAFQDPKAQGSSKSLVKAPLTPRQLAARRANARKSTGPRTAAGKRCSSLNSSRWRFCSRLEERVISASPEDARQFRRLHRSLVTTVDWRSLDPTTFRLESRLWGLREFAPTDEASDPIAETALFFPAGLGQIIDIKGDTRMKRENEANRLNGTESNSYPIIGPDMRPSFAVQTKRETQVLTLPDVSPQK